MMLIRYVGADGDIHIGLQHASVTRRLPVNSIADLLEDGLDRVDRIVAQAAEVDTVTRLLAPVDGRTEVWAAGVTYQRSRDARMEESREADPYDRVYTAERPELFFKSTAWRVSGPGEPVAVRRDSTIDVPEAELALVVTAEGDIAGYTISNDMSSRSIEGDNPLYLPQAKVYEGACSLGPGIVLAAAMPDPGKAGIEIEIMRGGAVAWSGQTDTGRMVRSPADLVHWLYAELEFPAGCILSTGTGVVPDLGFTLEAGDEVTIRIDGIGTLTNPVVRGYANVRG